MMAIRLLPLIIGVGLISACAQNRQPESLALAHLFSQGDAKLVAYTNNKAATERNWAKGREAQGLLCFAADGHLELVLHLLKLGVSEDSTFESRPAAQYAVRGNHEDILQTLADEGADLSVTWIDPDDKNRDSLLNVAFRENASQCVPILIARKVTQMPSTNTMEQQRKIEWLKVVTVGGDS